MYLSGGVGGVEFGAKIRETANKLTHCPVPRPGGVFKSSVVGAIVRMPHAHFVFKEIEICAC
ncbi:hypothetical protein BGAL_0146g00170 [Botrytis galanthina]|uniref:Uncharacterized protein n=1 Tax=Botrytis galanthina TaxID=278940 RepID=A0A4S8R0T2_9HELO|nr:hypothetical protein BGAL_0146g00170 [Botrytis galanthina]